MESIGKNSQPNASELKPEDVRQLYRKCVEGFAKISSGRLINNRQNDSTAALLQCSQFQAGQRYDLQLMVTMSGGRSGLWETGLSEVVNICYSPTRRYTASFVNKDVKAVSGDKVLADSMKNGRIYVWDQELCVLCLTLEVSSKLHGEFWTGGSNCCFSGAENKLEK